MSTHSGPNTPDSDHEPGPAVDAGSNSNQPMSPLAPEVVDEKAQTNAISEQQSSVQSEAPYSVVPEREKIFLMLLCSFAALISPLAGSIYFPAIVAIADDLDVSIAKINLTITMYLIFQGLAPSVVASLSDTYGRRPPYIACFMIFLGANIGLAVQDSYPALMVLRCLQSSGSSGTVALGSATVADLATRAERGKYIAYASMGITLGPALGPVIGGLLSHFLGWRAIFWFLVIFSGVFGAFLLVFLPETCRAVVGNGSVPPPVWNRSLWQIARSTVWRSSSRTQRPEPAHETIHTRRKRRNPLIAGAMVARDAEAALILIFGGLLFSGYMAVMSTLAPELESRFGFNSIQIGLCYLPFGVGSLTSRFTLGRLLDLNFRREAKRQNLPIEKNKQQDLTNFNIEIARLTITIPFVYASCAFLVAYGWVLQARTSLAAIVIFLFLSGHTATAAFSSLNTLVVDINPETPATAVAANNLFRCLLGAGAVAVAKPLIDRIGIGWAATFVAGLLVVFSPCLWAVYLRGYRWRRGRRERRERLEQAKGNAAKAMTPGETSKAA